MIMAINRSAQMLRRSCRSLSGCQGRRDCGETDMKDGNGAGKVMKNPDSRYARRKRLERGPRALTPVITREAKPVDVDVDVDVDCVRANCAGGMDRSGKSILRDLAVWVLNTWDRRYDTIGSKVQ